MHILEEEYALQKLKDIYERAYFIIWPLIAIIIFYILNSQNIIAVNDYIQEYLSNVINVSGVIAGFQTTGLSILFSLPETDFFNQVLKSKRWKSIYRCTMLAFFTLILAMVFGVFRISIRMTSLFFVIGITNTVLGAFDILYLIKLRNSYN